MCVSTVLVVPARIFFFFNSFSNSSSSTNGTCRWLFVCFSLDLHTFDQSVWCPEKKKAIFKNRLLFDWFYPKPNLSKLVITLALFTLLLPNLVEPKRTIFKTKLASINWNQVNGNFNKFKRKTFRFTNSCTNTCQLALWTVTERRFISISLIGYIDFNDFYYLNYYFWSMVLAFWKETVDLNWQNSIKLVNFNRFDVGHVLKPTFLSIWNSQT